MTDPPPEGVTRKATVVRVVDADTLLVETVTRYRLRLLGVNAPEKKTPEGKAAAEYMRQLAENKRVTVHIPFDAARTAGDLMSFERVLGRAWLDGQELSQHLIETGHGTSS